MFGARSGSYAACVDTDATVTNRLTLAPPSLRRRSVAKSRGSLILRCLKAIAESYLQSSAYNPYWIGAGPLAESRGSEAQQG